MMRTHYARPGILGGVGSSNDALFVETKRFSGSYATGGRLPRVIERIDCEVSWPRWAIYLRTNIRWSGRRAVVRVDSVQHRDGFSTETAVQHLYVAVVSLHCWSGTTDSVNL